MLAIRDSGRVYYVSLHDVSEPPPEMVVTGGERWGKAATLEFLEWWNKMAEFFDCPHQAQAEPGAIRIVRAKLRSYSLDELKALARVFWMRHAAPLREDNERGPVREQIRYFASRLAEVKREVEDA